MTKSLSLSALLLVLGAGCTVPSLQELEAQRPRQCDASHLCADGYTCGADGLCRGGDESCSPGASRACGTDLGECTTGTQTCTAAGTWDTCSGIAAVAEVCDLKDNDCDGQTDEDAQTNSCGVEVGVCAGKKKACISGSEEATCSILSFGGEFQPGGAETACDGKDNDCDGLVDEALSTSCGVDAGVCKGATQSCRDGGFFGCSTADFLANNPQYEPYEGKCDTVDNDCDGLIDAWSERLVSDAGAVARQSAVAVAIPDAGSTSQADVLAFYEEGSRVVMRQLFADGRYNAPVYPAASVPAATKAYGPALGTDGAAMVAAWFDELPLTGGQTSYRLNVGLPRANGESFINGSPGATPILQLTGPGKALHVVANGGRIGIVYEWEDLSAGSVTKVGIANCPINLSTACATATLPTTGLSRPRAALGATGTELWVVYENAGDGDRSYLLKADLVTTGTPSLTLGTGFSISANQEGEPWVLFNASALKLFFLGAGGGSGGNDRVKTRTCSLPCSSATNLTGGTTDYVSATSVISNLAMLDMNGTSLALFDQNTVVGNGTEVRYAVGLTATRAGVISADPTGKTVSHPWPVNAGRGANASTTVLFSSTATNPGVVMSRRLCGP